MRKVPSCLYPTIALEQAAGFMYKLPAARTSLPSTPCQLPCVCELLCIYLNHPSVPVSGYMEFIVQFFALLLKTIL